MKKLVLASAVSALFVAPATVLAGQPPAVPTLDKVLEASGVSVSGYIDAGYTHADRNLEAGGFSTRVFDSLNNSFVLRQLGLTIAKQPKEGFGGLVNVTAGRDAQLITSVGAATSQFDLTQAYAQYATGPLTVIAGKYATMHGTEVIASPGNANISRSILFGSVPFTHTGLRGTWALNDQYSLMLGVNNGWDQLTDANKGKTLEVGATLNPIKPLTVAVSGMSGKEVITPGGTAVPDGTRTSVNAVASYTIIDPLSVGLEFLNVSQENTVGGTAKGKYTGAAGYVSYTISKFKVSGRVEQLDDKDGIRFGTANNKYREVTLTGAFLAADNFELRGEVRRDQANNAVFTGFDGSTSKNLMTLAAQALYKF